MGRAEVTDRIVAVVNDEVITQHELRQMMVPFLTAEQQPDPSSPRDLQQVQDAALQQLIDEHLVVQAARKAKITVEESDVEERFRDVRARFGTPEEFERSLADEGLTRQDLLDRFRNQLLSRKLIEQQVRARISVSPTEVEAYYVDHQADFAMLEEVQARHLLIRVNDARTEADAKQLAEELYAKLQADHGASFAELARQHSQAPEAEQGGDLGWVRRGQLMAELEGPLFALPIGGLSAPFQSKLGYHLFFVEDRHAGGQQTLEEMRVQVEDRVYAEKFKQAMTAWLAKLREQAYIQVRAPSVTDVSSEP